MKIIFVILIAFFFAPFPPAVFAQAIKDYDVAATVGSIAFIPAEIHAGEQTRIYGTIVNVGNKDISGYVGFYQGVILLGKPQPFSLKAGGAQEEFWVDWTPIEGTYNVMMTVIETEPADQNPANNVALTRMMTITRRPAPPSPVPVLAPVVIPKQKTADFSPPAEPKIQPGAPIFPQQLPQQKKPAEQKDAVKKEVVPSPQPKLSLKHFSIPLRAKDGKQKSETSASAETATTTPPLQFAEALSAELTKSVGLFKVVEEASSTSQQELERVPSVVPSTPKKNASSPIMMIAGSIAVILFLIGLLFLKKSKS